MAERRYIITGCRDFADKALVERVITDLVSEGHRRSERTVVVHGACPTGADAFADEVAKRLLRRGFDVVVEAHPADWQEGPAAGPKRNRKMAELGAYRCVAFWDGESAGTLSAIREAVRARILVVIRTAGETG